MQLCDAHERSEGSCLDVESWINDGPLEARGGHQKAAPCLAEISRHSSTAYVIPILLLGSSLGSPLLPLTMESQDFGTVVASTNDDGDRQLLQKWYVLDEQTQPQCYRLRADAEATVSFKAVFTRNFIIIYNKLNIPGTGRIECRTSTVTRRSSGQQHQGSA